MPPTIVAALSISLAICSPFATAQTAAPDPRIDQVDRVISLTKALVRGVEQCFNPSHTKGNAAAKNRLFKLETTALSAKSSLASGDASNLAREKWDWTLSPALLRISFASLNLDLPEAIAWIRSNTRNE